MGIIIMLIQPVTPGFEKMVQKKNVWNSYFISLPSLE